MRDETLHVVSAGDPRAETSQQGRHLSCRGEMQSAATLACGQLQEKTEKDLKDQLQEYHHACLTVEAQYSPEAITAAMSLQIYTVSLILVDPVAVDNLITIVPPVQIRFVLSEWTFLLGSRWIKVKGLYIVTQYVPFLFFIGHIYMDFINENPDKCQMLNTICEG
ncbi:hypothetical protein M405DRAFT_885930, partial [Rhizopogon salebrosus TDB-379]